MSVFSIVQKNIWNFAKKFTTVFVIMLLGLTVSTVTLIYVLVKIDCLSDDLTNGWLELDIITMDNTQANLGLEEITERLQNYCESNGSVRYISGAIQDTEYYASVIITDEQAFYQDLASSTSPMKGRFFTDEELTDGADVCMLSIGKTERTDLTTDELSFEIVGYLSLDGINNAYLPYQTARKYELVPATYSVCYNSNLDLEGTKAAVAELQELFPELEVESDMDTYKNNSAFYLSFENLCLILMALVSVLSAAYLYLYIIQKRIHQIFVFKITGATTGYIVKIYLAELSAMLIMQFFLSYLIFRLGIVNFVKKYDIVFAYGYSWGHILVGFLVMTMLALFTFLPVLFFYCRKNAVQIRLYEKG